MNRRHLVLVLVLIAISNTPIDLSVIINRTFGWKTHWILYMILIAVIIYLEDGNTLREKINNLFKLAKSKMR